MNPPLSILVLPHVDSGLAGGFAAGLWHPVSGLDHAIAMIAVGLWAAQLGGAALWRLPVGFMAAMALGGALGSMGLQVPGVELGIAVSGVVLVALVLSASRPAPWVALLVVSLFALLHGHAHGTEVSAGASAVLYSAGFLVATGALHLTGIALGLLHRGERSRPALRARGAAGVAGRGPD